MLFYLTSAPTTPAITLHHAFGDPNHDDSVHVDVATTTPTPQSFSTTCCGPWVLMVRDLLAYVCEIMSESRKCFDKNGGHVGVTTSTVKMACVDNDAWVSDQAGCHIKPPETQGLNKCALCWVCLV
jgi:hypothetical protein